MNSEDNCIKLNSIDDKIRLFDVDRCLEPFRRSARQRMWIRTDTTLVCRDCVTESNCVIVYTRAMSCRSRQHARISTAIQLGKMVIN